MNPYSIPPLVTALLALVLCFFVISRNPRSIVNLTFAAGSFSTTYWQGTWAVLFNIEDPNLALLIVKIGYSGIIFIPVVFFHFIDSFTRSGEKRLVVLFYIVGITFLIFLWFSNLYIIGAQRFFWGFYPKKGVLHPLYIVALAVMFFRGLYLLVRYRQQVSTQPIRVNQANYVIASTIIYGFASSDFLVNYGFEVYPIGFLFTTTYTLVTAYAIIRYRLLDINVFIRKTLVYALLLLLLLLPCYFLVVVGQQWLFGRVNYPFSFMILVLFIVVGFLFPKFRFKTEAALERVLFKERYDYRETLLRFSGDMVSIVDLETLSNKLLTTIAMALGIEKASLFLFDEIKGSFGLKTSIGLDLNHFRVALLPWDDPLVRELTKRPQPLVREELEMAHDRPGAKELAQKMGELEAEVTLPLRATEKPIGILSLGYKEGREMYSHEDLELLSTLTNQAAIAIENARLYENLKQSQSIIRRADRLSSLGMLTAGLAHEIRNPLVAIRTFTQLLPERYQDQEFREEFKSIALREVDRICGLVNDLLSFARPSTPNVAAEDINEIVEGIARILETEAKERGVQIYRRLAPDLPKVFVDKEQIKQVSMNVILNAIQSIEGEGVVEVSTRLFTRDGAERFVQIGVRDSGMGIPEKDIENIFNPFFTTKKGGSGLGLSISHQIVQEHRGYIIVESKVGEGTTFFVNLPIRQNHKAANTRPRNS